MAEGGENIFYFNKKAYHGRFRQDIGRRHHLQGRIEGWAQGGQGEDQGQEKEIYHRGPRLRRGKAKSQIPRAASQQKVAAQITLPAGRLRGVPIFYCRMQDMRHGNKRICCTPTFQPTNPPTHQQLAHQPTNKPIHQSVPPVGQRVWSRHKKRLNSSVEPFLSLGILVPFGLSTR